MQAHCGVFRFPDMLKEGIAKIGEVAEQARHTAIADKSRVFNTARVEALELDNLWKLQWQPWCRQKRGRKAAAPTRAPIFPSVMTTNGSSIHFILPKAGGWITNRFD